VQCGGGGGGGGGGGVWRSADTDHRWPSSGSLSRNVSVLKVKCPWKTGGRESGHETCSQTPTNETPATAGKQATAGMLATARIPAATGTPALSKGHH
jgi:hypothetical protein